MIDNVRGIGFVLGYSMDDEAMNQQVCLSKSSGIQSVGIGGREAQLMV